MLGGLVPLNCCNRLLIPSQNALRVSHTPTAFGRQLSTLALLRNRPLPFRDNSQKFLQIHWLPSNSRHISIGSIFSRKPPPTPSPTVVAQITRLEGEANANPHDVAKQLALFQALVDTKLKSSYELVISRWERMCEFDPKSPLLHSAPAFQTYLACLINTNQQGSIDAAVRRRDSLLAAPGQSPGLQDVESSPPTQPNVKEDATGLSSSMTSSQQIAQNALANHVRPDVSAPVPGITNLLPPGSAATNPVLVTIVERKGAWIPRLIRFLASLAVTAFIFLVILSVMFENSGIMKNGPRQAVFEAENQKVTFDDVHGVDEAKDELRDVVEFLKDPSSFGTLGGKLPKGILLTGSPGTGKTMLARAVAGEAGVPFFLASGSDFEEMFVGVGAKRVRELFAAARKKQPAIIFIDELDAVGGKRSSRDQQYMKQTLNQLLVEMDGFQQSEGVIVIAATNFPQSLDQALVRPGRFDRIIAVPLPDIRGRVQILQHHMKGVKISEDVDPSILARGTPGFSGADLQNLINLAAIQASKEKAPVVTLKHLEWAKDRILMGAERKSQYIEAKEKMATAYHEGGHALVALYTDGAMPLHKVTCLPRGHSLGMTTLLPENDRTSVSQKQFRASIDVFMGGRVAEELIYGPDLVTSGASSDINQATQIARAMVQSYGYSPKLGPVNYDNTDNLSAHRKEQIEDEVTGIIRAGESRATAILTSKLDELHLLAKALVEHETLNGEEVRKVIKGEQIRSVEKILEEELNQSKANSS